LGIPSYATGQSIVVITGDNLKYTGRTISGARSVIRNDHTDAVFHEFNLNDLGLTPNQCVDSIKRLRPALILTVGSAATRFAQTRFDNTPIVFSAVMYPAISGFVSSLRRPGSNLTGTSLDIPADIQFAKFKHIIPSLKRIGVLYTGNTAPLIKPSKTVARKMGLTLVPIRIDDLKEIPKALDSLARSVDGIWSVADPNLFSPQSTKYILLNSLRRGLPFMGFSRYVVESGALFALDFDYKAIGRQAGGLANRILQGEKPGDLPVTVPDIIWFHYNEKTAQHLNCSIPDELVAIAKEVYR
jgi:putative ABC transport system substrate-binding protein